MVVFCCGHCGESVQKPKVEKHYLTKCRNRNPNLSCMDCFKDFLGNDYEGHIKCITEEQRYSGKDFIAKEKKGEKKQNAWLEMLQCVLDEQRNASKNVLRIIETITKHNNTPRKKPKFINFVKNVCGPKTNLKDIEEAWDLISVKLFALSNVNSENNDQNQKKNTNKKDETQNGDVDYKEKDKENTDIHHNEKKQNGDIDNKEDQMKDDMDKEKEHQNRVENVNLQNSNAINNNEKKLSKKQRKEEKKRKKYEAELQSVSKPLTDIVEEGITISKKGKKKKCKVDSAVNGDVNETVPDEVNSKNKKRKRCDTVNGNQDIIIDNGVESIDKEKQVKLLKKKQKINCAEETEDSICLHDQNVAKTEEFEDLVVKKDKFNWHAIILSVLEKKGNEVPFKRLQKKVLAEYSEITGRDIDDRIAEKFIKKLKSAPNVRVDKNRVLLEQ